MLIYVIIILNYCLVYFLGYVVNNNMINVLTVRVQSSDGTETPYTGSTFSQTNNVQVKAVPVQIYV